MVISEEQGEIEKFDNWELDIIPHRKLIKEGIDLPETMRNKPQYQNKQRMELDEAFKDEEHPFRIAIVCAMWLTGFDVPCLSTLYLDKPLKAHTLMQAIARANRVKRKQKQRPDRRLLRRPRPSAPGTRDLRWHATGWR